MKKPDVLKKLVSRETVTRRIFIKNSSCQAESFGASGLTKDAFVLFLNELLTGTFGIGTLNGQIDLADGVVYNIEIFIKDKALNETNTTLAENITFDVTKPEFTQVSPVASSRVNTQTVSWNVSENLQSGKHSQQ